jgi:hypothetical protein
MIEYQFKGFKLSAFSHEGKFVVFQEKDAGLIDIKEFDSEELFKVIGPAIGMFEVACLSCDWQGMNFALEDYQCPECAGNVVDADELEDYSSFKQPLGVTDFAAQTEDFHKRIFAANDPYLVNSPVIIFDGEGNILGHGEGE